MDLPLFLKHFVGIIMYNTSLCVYKPCTKRTRVNCFVAEVQDATGSVSDLYQY